MPTPDHGRYVLKASCVSRAGTVARISTFLADRRRCAHGRVHVACIVLRGHATTLASCAQCRPPAA
jgi:hypothetical protein